MNKLTIIFFLLIAQTTVQCSAPNKPFITLLSQEGEAIIIPVEVAKESPTLKAIALDIPQAFEVTRSPIDIPINAENLRVLVKGMRIREDNPKIKKFNNPRVFIELIMEKLDLKNKSFQNLLDLYRGADFLGLEAVKKAIAHALVKDPQLKKYVAIIRKEIEDLKEGKEREDNPILAGLLEGMGAAHVLENGKYYDDLPIVELDIHELMGWNKNDLARKYSLEIYKLLEDNEIDSAQNLLEKRGNILDLSHCKLKQLSSRIGFLTNLKMLVLDNNKLQELPNEIGKLINLEHLYLHYNELQKLPSTIGNLSQLKILWAYNNELQTLPNEIGQLDKLEDLYLNFNQLRKIPSSIGNLSSLNNLVLESNQLRDLPDEIGKLTKLNYLELSNNLLTQLPDSIGNMLGLRRLYLFQNQLQMLPAGMNKLINLQVLYLEHNKLMKIPNWISDLSQLRTLGLDYNQLHEIPDALSKLPKLQKLSLEGNPLSPDEAIKIKSLFLGRKIALTGI